MRQMRFHQAHKENKENVLYRDLIHQLIHANKFLKNVNYTGNVADMHLKNN